MDKSMIDASNGGALMDITPTTARHLISNMARPSQSWMVNEIGTTSNLTLENQLSELTSLVRQLAIGQHQPNMAAKVCGICTSMEHPTNLYPTLQEIESDQPENVGAIGGYQYGKQPYQNRPLDNQQTESRALCSVEIWTYTEYTSRINKLPTAESAISSTTFPTAAAAKNSTSRQFSISRGPDEVTRSQQFGVSAIYKLQ
ncbi:hypothetical protein CR513_09928, partial [Mucuna pruriens]